MSKVFFSFTRNFLLRSRLIILSKPTNFSQLSIAKFPSNSNIKFLTIKDKLSPTRVGIRPYCHVPLTIMSVSDRIMLTLRCFDKIDPEKITLDSNLMKDMGIDSLDHVEVIMAVEEEFGFEIPDQEAVKLNTPKEIIQYVCDKFDVYE